MTWLSPYSAENSEPQEVWLPTVTRRVSGRAGLVLHRAAHGTLRREGLGRLAPRALGGATIFLP